MLEIVMVCGHLYVLSLHSLSLTDNIPALCCAANHKVAECLELILQAMLEQRGIAL